ncbi:MAG: glycosyltransferase family 2 protein [Polyangiaceae bacterium]
MSALPYVTCVIPFFDEEATLEELHRRLDDVLRTTLGPARTFEIVFVDDGSTDGGAERVRALTTRFEEVRLLRLRGNFGKSAALAAGFEDARGDIVVTLDADLQDEPREIPRFLERIEAGFDVVSGFKQHRKDPFHKVLPSRAFNAMVRALTGLRLRDVNCGFKAYRRIVTDNVRIYGELHRFVPALAHMQRFRVDEIVVEHHARAHGVSKFGTSRFFRGAMDLVTVWFLLKFDNKPSHFFSGVGFMVGFAGFAVCLYMTFLKIRGEAVGHRPLLILGVLLVVVGVQTMATGLIAELVVFLSRSRSSTVVREIVRHEEGTVGREREASRAP